MNEKQAIEIIRETFESSFERGRFKKFVKNLLNEYEEAEISRTGNYIPDAFEDYVSKYERLGKYEDGDNKRIDILIIYLKRVTSIERARSMQRNFIAGYLQGKYGSKSEKDAALVAFVAPGGEEWRFSLVKLEVKLEANKIGGLKVVDEFTPAKRWSYLVGSHEKSHTAQSRLVHIMEDDERNPTMEELEEAFNIEKVTKEFFEKYRDLFIRTKRELDMAVAANLKLKADFKSKHVDTVNIAKKLLGQIIFLYFLQKKGWFGVPRDGEWGQGSKKFLRDLFSKKSDGENYFNDILEHLFYDALRNDRSHDDHYYGRFNCKIPFLNGGLFDPMNNYDWIHTDILLPDKLFSNKTKTKEGDEGDGILDVFDRYNFTVKEDEPFDKEVAIDPELLGKAYEKFNAIRPDNFDEFLKALKSGKKGEESKFNKQYGVYYTPRGIVHYMCQQSLINYLYLELNPNVVHQSMGDDQLDMSGNVAKSGQIDITVENRSITKIPKEDIYTLIVYGEQIKEHDAHVVAEGRETKKYTYQMPESIRNNAPLIDEKLAAIKVCDPAVGSGAFPVGMMSEIVKARNALENYAKTFEFSKTSYDFKRECIENSLYGVDIDEGAVEIAKLRLWLSLIVDEDDIHNIKPLPNLDYKIVCGDSLLGVEKNLFNLPLFNELESLKPLYFNETNPIKKQERKNRIDKLINDITNGHADFDFEVYFSEVFHHKGGFDVVLGNPPYISYGIRDTQSLSKNQNVTLRARYPNSAEYKISIYALFMDKAIQISHSKGGVQTFIVPDSFLLGRYFSNIRKFILQQCEILEIILLPFGVFEATVGFSVVYLLRKTDKVSENHEVIAKISTDESEFTNNSMRRFSYSQSFFNNRIYNRFVLFFDKTTKRLIEKIELGSTELGKYVSFGSGLISNTGQKNIIAKERKGKDWLPGVISGGEISPYLVSLEGNYLHYKKEVIKSGYENIDYFHEKLFMRQTGDRLICAYDDKGLLGLNNVHIGNYKNKGLPLKYVMALLNSKLLNYYYKTISLETGRVMAQTDIETIEKLPLKTNGKTFDERIVAEVDRILISQRAHPKTDPSRIEKDIDQLVFQLYGLTKEEIKIVEGEE